MGGKLHSVKRLGFVDASMGADGGHLCIPPEAFVLLATGFRSLDECILTYPDLIVKPEAHHLLSVLFPRMSAYLYTPYYTLTDLT